MFLVLKQLKLSRHKLWDYTETNEMSYIEGRGGDIVIESCYSFWKHNQKLWIILIVNA